ncbi:GNAT family N-acetyltransferase [Paenibacillus harenae]|uniref:GNAT family N-acetyltransferase n=1 Tax=Paenibacillus harenae TaxID=306543 RepID=UPI0004045959|nr:GNAT family N-acetyltransferase [Paenibacillus harenae]
MIVKECQINEVQDLVEVYISALSSPFDSFLEGHILESAFFMIQEGAAVVGYYAIHNNETLTQFYIRRSHQRHAQKMFSQALEGHAVKSLFVPTSDELFLSLAIDKEFTINKQAYFFQDSQAEIADGDLSGDETFRLADLGDLHQIQQVCGDFLDQYEQRIVSGQLFTFIRGNVLLGIGVVERSKMIKGLASIGMLTNEAYRKQGVGRVIILQLRKWCRQQGITPVSGCWYYNEASKRTLESAGMVTKTRLLNVKAARHTEDQL